MSSHRLHNINSLQCYELTRRYSHLLFIEISPLTYAVYLWPVHCECAMKHNRRRIFNYLQIRDTGILVTAANVAASVHRPWIDNHASPLLTLHGMCFINSRMRGLHSPPLLLLLPQCYCSLRLMYGWYYCNALTMGRGKIMILRK